MTNKRLLFPAILLAVILAGRAGVAEEEHHFHLHGGFFYGPGPIKPDTALPDGDIKGIAFDTTAWRGEAKFVAGTAPLSDGKTYVNANIDAGRLGIGENGRTKTFWLTAVDGGPNKGTEKYSFDSARNFVWQVDLALDPGFAEGIIRVDDFRLTTGWVQVQRSLQTVAGAPGGYDKAGSLPSGTFLVGRVGDFDRNGFLDGVLVASANVPMQADMLPGAPVANLRGFTTDIPVDPLSAAEMTLAGVDGMRPVVSRLMADADLPQLKSMLGDIGGRIDAASRNYEDAFLKADGEGKQRLQAIGWRIETARKLFFIPWAFLAGYENSTGKPSTSVRDSVQLGFEIISQLLPVMRDLRAVEKRR